MLVQSYNRASSEHPDRVEDAIALITPSGMAPVFAVIDGMGGQQHDSADGTRVTGRDAAQIVRETLIEDLSHLPPDVDASPGGDAEQRITAALARAHTRVRAELNNNGGFPRHECVGAVATITALCENGARLLTVQVGDTRAYVLSDGELIQLCQDEDNLEFLVRSGMLGDKDAARIGDILNMYDGIHEPRAQGRITIAGNAYELYIAWRWFMDGNSVLNIPPSNIVISTLGIDEQPVTPQYSRFELSSGDRLLLGSDGLYKNLSDDEIAGMISGEGDAAARLGDAAYARSQDTGNQRSVKDDISAIAVEFGATA